MSICKFYILIKLSLIIVLTNQILTSPLTTMSYVEVNSNEISIIGNYIRTDNMKPFFQMTSIFAANINGDDPNKPYIYFNENVSNLLHNEYDQIRVLKLKGVKVLITLLGNHQNAGWSCMTDDKAIKLFAKEIVDMIIRYDLDGLDIDDEYSTCEPNLFSIEKITKSIKEDQRFVGKLLTKALWNDSFAFVNGNLSKYLDYGWEMSYQSGDFSGRLSFYENYGMTKKKLYLGSWNNHYYPSPDELINFLKTNQYQGIMVYDMTSNSLEFLNVLCKAMFGDNVKVEYMSGLVK